MLGQGGPKVLKGLDPLLRFNGYVQLFPCVPWLGLVYFDRSFFTAEGILRIYNFMLLQFRIFSHYNIHNILSSHTTSAMPAVLSAQESTIECKP